MNVGDHVLVAGQVEAVVDAIDDDLHLIHTASLPGCERSVVDVVGVHSVEGWRGEWQLDPIPAEEALCDTPNP